MNAPLGAALIACGAALGLGVMLLLWRRIPPTLAMGLLFLSGVFVGAGGLLVQAEADAGSWVIALGTLGILAPVHARFMCGPPGATR